MSRSSSSSEGLELVLLWTALGIASLVFGRFTMQYMAEDPIRIDKALIFKDTDDSRLVAVSCTDAPPSYRPLDIWITLSVPHTEYNSRCRNFVVRLEYISENGKVLPVTSWHRMNVKFRRINVKFRSRLMNYLMSYLRIVPFLSDVSSDAQVEVLTSVRSGSLSTMSCIRVTLHDKFENFNDGVCVPQISAAHVLLQSQLPHIKWILWDWWNTIFICISILSFGLGVMCFRDVFIPKRRVR